MMPMTVLSLANRLDLHQDPPKVLCINLLYDYAGVCLSGSRLQTSWRARVMMDLLMFKFYDGKVGYGVF